MLEMLKFVFSLKSYFTKLKVGYFSFLLTFIDIYNKKRFKLFFFFFQVTTVPCLLMDKRDQESLIQWLATEKTG